MRRGDGDDPRFAGKKVSQEYPQGYPTIMTRRLLCLLTGLVLMGLGVALGTRPGLGTTAISSAPYVLHQIWGLSFGTWTVLFNIGFMVAQMLILGRRYRWTQLFQLPAVALFGVFIDLGMYLTGFWTPEHYLLRFAETLLGAAVMAAGITALLIADLVFVPGDGLVQVISQVFHLNFGKVKICFDCSLVALAIALSFLCLHRLDGVREGTILAALCVGQLVRIYQPLATWISQKIVFRK